MGQGQGQGQSAGASGSGGQQSGQGQGQGSGSGPDWGVGTTNLDALADMNITIVEGGIILDKGRAEKGALPRQVLMLRDLVKTLFAPA